MPSFGPVDWDYFERVIKEIFKQRPALFKNLFRNLSKIFRISHRRIASLVVLLIIGGAFLTNIGASASSQGGATQSIGYEPNPEQVKAGIAELTLGQAATDFVIPSTTNFSLAANGVLASTPSVFTGQVAGRLRSDITFYDVRPKETLSQIAERFGISTATIIWANGIDDPNMVKTGQKLMILPVSGLLYKAAAHDTIASIAKRYKTTAAKIISFNDLDTHPLTKNMILILPGGSKALPKPKVQATTTASSQPNWLFWGTFKIPWHFCCWWFSCTGWSFSWRLLHFICSISQGAYSLARKCVCMVSEFLWLCWARERS